VVLGGSRKMDVRFQLKAKNEKTLKQPVLAFINKYTLLKINHG